MIMTGAPTTSKSPGRTNNLGAMRSGYLDGVLALGVRGAEHTQGLPGLIEAIGVLDGHSEGAVLQQPPQALQVLRARHRPDVVTPRSFAGRRVRRGATAVVLEDLRVGVEAFWGVGDEVEEGLDAVGVALVHERGDVDVAIEYLVDADLS